MEIVSTFFEFQLALINSMHNIHTDFTFFFHQYKQTHRNKLKPRGFD